jgi:hypothetical protein
LRTCKDTSNLVQGPTYTFQNHTTIFLEDQSLTNCHNTTKLSQCAISHSTITLSILTHDHHTPDI